MKEHSLTKGSIFRSLLTFAVPVFLALFLQAMYGAADLIIVGQFAGTGDQSGVASGSQLFNTATMLVVGLTMGVTVFVARCMGAGEKEKAARGVGTSIVLFALVAIVGTAIMVPGSEVLTRLVHAPQEAFGPTQDYIQVCGIGMVFIVFYNVLGAIFRGLGDSRTPLFTVAVACLFNIAGDLFLVAGLGMGAKGAAIATVSAQALSVLISLVVIWKRGLPFAFSLSHVRFFKDCLVPILKVGVPIALQDVLVHFSFLFIQIVVNGMGVVESAAVGVAEKVCVFLMLTASAFMQSISAFVAQNNGAGLQDRSRKALSYGIRMALFSGAVMGGLALFFGDGLFPGDRGHIGRSLLPESLRHRLPAHRHSLLLCGLFQRLRQNGVRHAPGGHRRILRPYSGGLSHERSPRGHSVPCGAGHSRLFPGADRFVPALLSASAEKGPAVLSFSGPFPKAPAGKAPAHAISVRPLRRVFRPGRGFFCLLQKKHFPPRGGKRDLFSSAFP